MCTNNLGILPANEDKANLIYRWQISAVCRLPVSLFYHCYCHGAPACCLLLASMASAWLLLLLGGPQPALMPSHTGCGVRCALSASGRRTVVGLCPPSFHRPPHGSPTSIHDWLILITPGAAHDWSHTTRRTAPKLCPSAHPCYGDWWGCWYTSSTYHIFFSCYISVRWGRWRRWRFAQPECKMLTPFQ